VKPGKGSRNAAQVSGLSRGEDRNRVRVEMEMEVAGEQDGTGERVLKLGRLD